jgi:hypothetical protein
VINEVGLEGSGTDGAGDDRWWRRGVFIYREMQQGHQELRELLTYIIATIQSKLCPWTNRVGVAELPLVELLSRWMIKVVFSYLAPDNCQYGARCTELCVRSQAWLLRRCDHPPLDNATWLSSAVSGGRHWPQGGDADCVLCRRSLGSVLSAWKSALHLSRQLFLSLETVILQPGSLARLPIRGICGLSVRWAL